jgi:predicted nucleic acid-binding protein
MKLVVDANILFSALIKKGKTSELLLDLSLELFTPEYVLIEFENHRQEILDKTKRTHEEFNEIFEILKEIIKIIPKEDFQENLDIANKISPDPDDTMYFALAMKIVRFGATIKKLKNKNMLKLFQLKNS